MKRKYSVQNDWYGQPSLQEFYDYQKEVISYNSPEEALDEYIKEMNHRLQSWKIIMKDILAKRRWALDKKKTMFTGEDK